MTKTVPILLLFLLTLAPATFVQAQQDTTRHIVATEGDTTYVMKRYVFVMLMRGDKANDYSKEEVAKLQEGHMNNMNRLAEEGKLIMAGPFGDNGDHRGLFILDCATIEEAEELVNTDPAIKAGRLRAEYHTWWGAVGTALK